MNWILAAFLMFSCSVGAYLLNRKAMLDGMPLSTQNFSSYIIPLFLYVPLSFAAHDSLVVTPYQFVILFITAILFSYLGGRFSLLSIKYAPNPGYSLILSKSYVVFTSIVAVLFFHSALTMKAVMGIVLIILFSSFIMIDPKAKHSSMVRPVWLPLSFGAFFCWGMLAISTKYTLDIGVPIYARLIYVMSIVSIIIYMEMKKEGSSIVSLTRKNKMLFFVMGALYAGFYYFMQIGYQMAPNIGYINAINASSIAMVSVGSAIFFHDEFNSRKFIGVIGVIIGLIVLVL